jgi:hypothetical protein
MRINTIHHVSSHHATCVVSLSQSTNVCDMLQLHTTVTGPCSAHKTREPLLLTLPNRKIVATVASGHHTKLEALLPDIGSYVYCVYVPRFERLNETCIAIALAAKALQTIIMHRECSEADTISNHCFSPEAALCSRHRTCQKFHRCIMRTARGDHPESSSPVTAVRAIDCRPSKRISSAVAHAHPSIFCYRRCQTDPPHWTGRCAA